MQTLNFYWVQKDGRKLRLSAKTVCRDLDLAFKVLNTTTGLTGFIQRYESPWYQVKYEKEVLWNSSDQLVPAPDDLGVALVHQSHPLRKTPTWKDNTNQAAWALERYQVLGFENKFIKVRSLANHLQEGYLEPGAVLLKVDFASFIMSNVKSWQAFQHREGNTLVLKNNTRVDIENLSSMMTKPELGILNQKAGSENLTARSTVEIKRGEWIQWAESDLKGHGRIFWKRSEHKPIGRKRSSYLSTEDVLEKTFFQSAIHPEKPDEALVSANGVFYTQDGKNWRGLATFNQENLPVAFGLNGELFVGNFRSTDRGQTFQPYLRWEDLTGLIEKRHKRTPGVLKISEVKVEQPGKIQITLDTGVLKAWLVGSVRYGLVTDWKVLKEQ
ncbi:MAG: hypothetical protein ACK5P7_01460 [Bdellovibrio sp.]